MRWKIVLEGTDEVGSAHGSELTIDKDMERLSAGEIGFSVEDGKAIMAHLQQVVVNETVKLTGVCHAVLSSGGVGSNIHAILDRWACFGGL